MILPAHLELDRVARAPDQRSTTAEIADVEPGTWKDRLEQQEKEALQRTLAAANGNLTRAAELFGVPRTTYRERLVRHGLLDA